MTHLYPYKRRAADGTMVDAYNAEIRWPKEAPRVAQGRTQAQRFVVDATANPRTKDVRISRGNKSFSEKSSEQVDFSLPDAQATDRRQPQATKEDAMTTTTAAEAAKDKALSAPGEGAYRHLEGALVTDAKITVRFRPDQRAAVEADGWFSRLLAAGWRANNTTRTWSVRTEAPGAELFSRLAPGFRATPAMQPASLAVEAIAPAAPSADPIAEAPAEAEILRDPEPAAAATVTKWSDEQRAIFEWVENGTGHGVVIARAGTGKTTTMREVAERIPRTASVLVLAFNVKIKDELKARIKGPNVTVLTLNAHGFKAIQRAWSIPREAIPGKDDPKAQQRQDDERGAWIFEQAKVPPPVAPWSSTPEFAKERFRKHLSSQYAGEYTGLEKEAKARFEDERWGFDVRPWNRYLGELEKLFALCRATLATTATLVREVQDDFDLLTESKVRRRGNPRRDGGFFWDMVDAPWEFYDPRTSNRYTRRSIEEWIVSAMRFALAPPPDKRIARFDCVYPVAMVDDIVPQQYDWVLVDETQDLSPADLRVVQKSLNANGRALLVGDDYQSIYRFRGADSRAIPRMIEELRATVFYLTRCYRVPRCVQRLVMPVVKDFRVPETTRTGDPWPEGVCDTIKASKMLSRWADGDFVISGTNAPLKPLALMALAEGKKALVLGSTDILYLLRDVAQGARREARGAESPEAYLDALEAYRVKRESILVATAINEDKKRRRSSAADRDYTQLPEVLELGFAARAVENKVKEVGVGDPLNAWINSVALSARDVENMGETEKANALKGRLLFTTGHKIKGSETEKVWVLEDTLKYAGPGTGWRLPEIVVSKLSDAEKQEAINLWYVMVTRPKEELHTVTNLEEMLGSEYRLTPGE